MTASVAANCTNTLQCKRLWMCRLSFAGLPEQTDPKAPHDGQKEDPDTWFEKYMNGLSVEPLKQAYVILVATSGGQTSVAPNACAAILCRTTDDGEILKIQESEVDGCVPPNDSAHLMPFAADSTYSYFWTYTKRIFKQVVHDFRADQAATMNNYEFGGFQVADQRHPPFESRGDHTFELMTRGAYELLQPFLFRKTSASSTVGSYPGGRIRFDLGSACKNPQGTSIAGGRDYIFARCRTIDSIYIAELVNYHAASLRQKTMKDFAVFRQVQDISDMALAKESVSEFEKENPDHSQYRKSFVDYAFHCAQQPEDSISRKLFSKAINIRPERDWMDAADTIMTLGLVHPFYTDTGYHYQEFDSKPVLHYFDFYRFGLKESRAPWNSILEFEEHNIERALQVIRAQIATFLNSAVPYDLFLIDLDTHCVSDRKVRKHLHTRFLEIALTVHYCWWEDLDVESDAKWKEREPYLEWIGVLPDKVGHLFTEHFGTLEAVEHYNALVEKSVKKAEVMLKKMEGLNHRLKGGVVNRKFKKFTLETDFAKGAIVVKEGGKDVTTFRFIEEVKSTSQTTFIRRRTHGKVKRTWVTRQVDTRHYTLTSEPPLKEFKSWPSWLETFGLALSLGLTVSSIVDMIKKDEEASAEEKVMAVARLSKDTCQFIHSFSEALSSSFEYAHKEFSLVTKFEKFGKKLKGPGLFLEAAINVKEGGTILLLGEESLAAQAINHGDPIEGWAQEAKGLVLVASVVPGMVATGASLVAGETAAVAFGAAIPPLGIALAIGALVVVAIEVGIYIYKGPSNVMDPIRDALEKALKKELGEDYQENRTLESVQKFSVHAAVVLA